MKKIDIFTDGGCKGNPGPGGYGCILKQNDHIKELKGGVSQTTNNIMELTAVIEALKALSRSCPIIITTDSNYVKDGITKWIHNWKLKGWKTAARKPVKNKELWISLDELTLGHDITWKWVKGHSGHPENERADELANEAIESFNVT